MENNRPEILAPCGSPDAVEAAVNSGCDAVYLGTKVFSARQGCKNFTRDELHDAVRLCHTNGVKIYQAINTLIFDSQTEQAANELKQACDMGIDGIIVQDLGVIALAKSICPDMPLHASTQMTIHTVSGAEICRKMGLRRVVAARELPLEAIERLCRTGIPIEAFVHGALCFSVSGQCYMSAMIGSRSANRGMCAQACRLPFSAVCGKEERHDLSLKDMSYIKEIKLLERAGVSSLKTEGRMKRPEYVAAAVHSCRQALCGKEYDEALLKNVFSRGGFTNGYLFSKTGRDMFGMRTAEDAQQSKEILPAIHELYRRPFKRFSLDMHLTARLNSEIMLECESGDLSASVKGSIVSPAVNKPTAADDIAKQLRKLGQTAYTAGDVTVDIDDGAFVSAAEINSLRRTAVSSLDSQRFKNSTVRYPCKEYISPVFSRRSNRVPSLRTELCDISQLDEDIYDNSELVCLPIGQLERLESIGEKMCAMLPRFDLHEEQTKKRIEKLQGRGLKHLTAANIAHFELFGKSGMKLHGGFGLNAANSLAAKMLKDLGAADITASIELTLKQARMLDTPLPLNIIGYGRLPAMLSINCPIKQAAGCGKCSRYITDRTGRRFLVKCSKEHGYIEILNCDVLWLADKAEELSFADSITLSFYDEKSDEIKRVIAAYLSGDKDNRPQDFTRGLYYRGIL